MYQNTCTADASAGSTFTDSESYTAPSANLFNPDNRAPIIISTRRFCPDAAGKMPRRKADRLKAMKNITGTLDDGAYFTIFTDGDIDKYTAEPMHMIMNFSPAVSSFTPLISRRRNDEGDFIRLDEDAELYDLLASTRYRYQFNISDTAAEELLKDEDTIKQVKALPEMNYIEYYSQYPKFTHPVLIYQILTIAKALYNIDREKKGMQMVKDTAGNTVKHTVQVIDIAEALINSASDIDWINLMYCEPSDLHKVISEVLDAAGYTKYSTVDHAIYSGVYTSKGTGGNVLEQDLTERVKKIDAMVWNNTRTVSETSKLYKDLMDLKNREHEPTI